MFDDYSENDNMDRSGVPFEGTYEQFLELLAQEVSKDHDLSERFRKVLNKMATAKFVDAASMFWNDFQNGTLLDEDTLENRRKKLAEFMSTFGVNVKDFIEGFTNNEGLEGVIVIFKFMGIDELFQMEYIAIETAFKLVRFYKGEAIEN